MFGNGNYNMYQSAANMNNAQQRLNNMERQFANNVMQPQPQQNFNQGSFLKGRAVSGIEEVRGAMIDMDGMVNIFTDFVNNKIYTKQLNADGTVIVKTYALAPTEAAAEPVNMGHLNTAIEYFNQQIQGLKEDLDSMKNIKEAQPSDKQSNTKNDASTNAKRQ